MTYTSYDEAPAETDDYTTELPLDERFKQTPVPLLVIFGAEDQILDAEESIEGYSDVPGVQTELIEDAGHAPQVEKPEEVAELLESLLRPARDPQARKNEASPRRRSRTKKKKPGSDPKNKKEKKKRRQLRGSDPTAAEAASL